MKKLITILLALLLLVLAGCNQLPPDITTEGPTTDPIPEESLVRPPEPTENPYEYPPEGTEPPVLRVQYLPAEINETDVPVLKWVCLMESFQGGGSDRIWNEAAVLEINEMLEALEAGFQLQFVMVTTDRQTYCYDWFSEPEVQALIGEADLIYGYIPRKDMPQYLAPITQYTTGMLANAVPHSVYWDCGRVNGEIYGIRTNVAPAATMGWYVDSSLLKKLELTPADFTGAFWEMDELLAQLDAELLGEFLSVGGEGISRDAANVFWSGYYPSALSAAWDSLHRIGSCFAIDYSEATPKVVNFLELPEVRQCQEAVVRYKKMGYVTDDWEKVKVSFGYGRYTEPTNTYGYLYIPVTEPFFNPSGTGYFSGIAAGSQHQKAAASLLGLIANSEDFRMQLFFGKKDRDYTEKDGIYTIVKQEDGSDYSMDFLSPLAYFCDLTQDENKASSRSPATMDNIYLAGSTGAEKLAYLRNALDDADVFLPIAFDFTEYEEECGNIKWVLKRYYPYMTNIDHRPQQNKPAMTPALYELMLEDLRDAGTDDLRWVLQKQLDEWLKQNPDG